MDHKYQASMFGRYASAHELLEAFTGGERLSILLTTCQILGPLDLFLVFEDGQPLRGSYLLLCKLLAQFKAILVSSRNTASAHRMSETERISGERR